jgi:hypothetical protein
MAKMRNKVILLLAALLLTACKVTPVDIDAELASFVGTKADAPLDGTIWHHDTGADFDKLVWFSDGTMRLFYGLIESGEIQRWSDFYVSPYGLANGVIEVSLSYPNYGDIEYVNTASIVSVAGQYSIDIDGETYAFVGTDASDFDREQWIEIIVGIAPWQ